MTKRDEDGIFIEDIRNGETQEAFRLIVDGVIDAGIDEAKAKARGDEERANLLSLVIKHPSMHNGVKMVCGRHGDRDAKGNLIRKHTHTISYTPSTSPRVSAERFREALEAAGIPANILENCWQKAKQGGGEKQIKVYKGI